MCLFFEDQGRGRKKPHPNSSHFNLFDGGRKVITSLTPGEELDRKQGGEERERKQSKEG